VSDWSLRSPAQARRLLGRLPTYADSAEALRWMAIKTPTSGGLDTMRAQLDNPLATLVIAGVLARRAPPGPDTTLVAARRALLRAAALPRDTALIRPLLGAAVVPADTAWLTTWAARQPTALARVVAFQELGLQGLLGGSSWPWFGAPETCLDE
jgi:hypothetical protein